MQDLFEVLNIDPLDITALIFAWKLNAKVPFEFTHVEFVNGCIALKADSIEKLKKIIRKSTPISALFCYVFSPVVL